MTCMNGRTYFCYHVVAGKALRIRKCDFKFKNKKFEKCHFFHHFCLCARSRADVDKPIDLAISLGQKVVRGPIKFDSAPRHYRVLSEDPDGTCLKMYFLSGIGLLKKGQKFSIQQRLCADEL